MYAVVRRYKSIKMSTTVVFEKYGSELCKKLPMEDPNFLQMLENYKILPGDSREKIQAKKTKEEKADFYIKNVIRTSLDSYLPSLLQAIEQYHRKYNDDALQDLLIHMIAEINGMFGICICKMSTYMIKV